MTARYLKAHGELIDKNNLKIDKAIEVVHALEKLNYFSFLECRKRNFDSAEIVVFDSEIEIGQKTVHDIRKIERLAVIFDPTDKTAPEVLALREDFPKVPHLNLRPEEKPCSLCLYDEKYAVIKLHWTPMLFLDRIREWLTLTSKGELHAADQPLEPLLTASSILVYDDFLSNESANNGFMIIRRQGSNWIIESTPSSFIAIPLKGEPQTAGIIYRQPKTLFELHNFLINASIDLLSTLRKRLIEIKNNEGNKSIDDTYMVLIIYLPKKRSESVTTEAADIWAFLVKSTIKEIGTEIGIWEIHNGKIGSIIGTNIDKKGEALEIDVLNPMSSCSREVAARMNGLLQIEDGNYLLIGCGALGSQIFINLIRSGCGNWTIVDDDCLLPHNLARHALPGFCIGHSKAKSLADLANNIIRGNEIAKAINADIMNPSESKDAIDKAFQEAQFIIDISTSIPVARFLARDINSSARRVSIFLNPSGTDLVMLAEDEKRDISLDCLEMQYYRYLINTPVLRDHLQRDDGIIRYARSCRDISSTIPQDLVALHSAICSRSLRNTFLAKDAHISLWKTNKDMAVDIHKVPVSRALQMRLGEWILYTDQYVLEKVSQARDERLPNETGGVLVGSFDMQRKIVYIADTILSPPDSVEWPTVYIRGCQGLRKQVDEIKRITTEMLDYVGEWHSHPRNCETRPSGDDFRAFEWLAGMMNIYGFPALMLIVGDGPRYSWYLGKME